MLQTEFLRNLNCNYQRILLDKNPEEKRYQYCMISRGGIKGLLPCSLRYINGLGYLYYDITSKQNVAQLYGKRPITGQWVRDFVWSMQQTREELARYLLDEQNILWYPQQVYQDLESNLFSFLYVPYYAGDNGFGKLLEFMIEHIDYEDERLVECVYKMFEQYELGGQSYLQNQIFKDVELLDGKEMPEIAESAVREADIQEIHKAAANKKEDNVSQFKVTSERENGVGDEKLRTKGIKSIFQSRRKREKAERDNYRETMQPAMSGYAVAEESAYEAAKSIPEETEWGKTLYIEAEAVDKSGIYGLYTPEGKVIGRLDKEDLTIGKKKGDADVILEDVSVSRMHARIYKEEGEIYLEDLNSTNGTYKNGLRLQPYEKRKLEAEDEITLGTKVLIFREMY